MPDIVTSQPIHRRPLCFSKPLFRPVHPSDRLDRECKVDLLECSGEDEAGVRGGQEDVEWKRERGEEGDGVWTELWVGFGVEVGIGRRLTGYIV